MKTFYIPAGERVAYESLYTEHLVLNGCLTIARDLRARTISGTATAGPDWSCCTSLPTVQRMATPMAAISTEETSSTASKVKGCLVRTMGTS